MVLQISITIMLALTTSSLAQQAPQGYPAEERYADSAPDSLIPSVPWPEWLPSDLSSLPNGAGQWVPLNGGQGQAGAGNPGMLNAINKLFGGERGGGGAPPPSYPGVPGAPPNFAGPAPGAPVAAGPRTRRFPKGDPRNCIKEGDKMNIMQVIPGLGWDNLRNVETGMVTSFSYSQCKVTYDRMYLIPDQTFAVPIKTSVVEHNSEFSESWDSYKSTTSRSINAGFDFFGKIGGKFSNEFQKVKSSMYNEKAISMRMELRHLFYSIHQLPDSKLHPSFKNRILDIMSLLKSNDTRSADYATQLLIRDYGTHYLTTVFAGAVLERQDNLKSTVKSSFNGRANAITAAGGVQFFSFLGAGGGYTTSSSESDLRAYREHVTSSVVRTFGGPPYYIGMNVTQWETNLINNLVAVDRSGRPLHSVITTENMKPEVIGQAEIFELKNLIENVATRYYDFNTHLGCTDVKAQNFDYQANAPFPGACKESARNYTFGGIFQTCSYIRNSNGMCANIAQKNPITGTYSCPSGYDAVLFISGEASRPKTNKNCEKVKKCSFFVFNCRRENKCRYSQTTEKVRHQTFWCAPKRNDDRRPRTGYLFGGIYSKDMKNPITRAKNCPNHYISMKIGSNARICLTEDYELGQQFALPFGGFFSCKAGNRLAVTNASDFMNNARSWPMQCPGGFTQHLALMENHCRVNYCVKAGSLLRAMDLDIVLPPFEPRPALLENSTTELYDGVDPNILENLVPAPPMPNNSFVVGSFGGGVINGDSDGDSNDGAEKLRPHALGFLAAMIISVLWMTFLKI